MLNIINKLSRIDFRSKWLVISLVIFGFLHLNIHYAVGPDAPMVWLANHYITAYLLLSWFCPVVFGILLTLFLWRADAALMAKCGQTLKGPTDTVPMPLWKKLLHVALNLAMLAAFLWTIYRLILLATGMIQWFTADRYWYERVTHDEL